MERFHVWMEELRAKHSPLSTHGLAATEGAVVRGLKVSDGPYAEANEVVGGYVLLAAENLADAVAAARRCPGLDYGMSVEVRPLQARG